MATYPEENGPGQHRQEAGQARDRICRHDKLVGVGRFFCYVTESSRHLMFELPQIGKALIKSFPAGGRGPEGRR